MTTVINIRQAPKGWEDDPSFVYIGRPGRGHTGYYGNPFILYHPKDREDMLHRYYDWAVNLLHTDPTFAGKVLDLDGKTLVCFCRPLACHGDVLIVLIDYMKEIARADHP